MRPVDELELTRFVEAIALGEIADAVFAETCAAFVIEPTGGVSPLELVAAAKAARERPARSH